MLAFIRIVIPNVIENAYYNKCVLWYGVFLLKSKLFQLLPINLLLAKLLLQFVFFRCIHRLVFAVMLMQSR